MLIINFLSAAPTGHKETPAGQSWGHGKQASRDYYGRLGQKLAQQFVVCLFWSGGPEKGGFGLNFLLDLGYPCLAQRTFICRARIGQTYSLVAKAKLKGV